MIGTPRLGLGTLALSTVLGMVMVLDVDAQSRGGSDVSLTQASGAMAGAAQVWPALEVMDLQPLWVTQGTPDGSGVGGVRQDSGFCSVLDYFVRRTAGADVGHVRNGR